MNHIIVSITLGILSLISEVSGKRNKQAYCGACIGLVQEMDWGLANTDGQKTLQVGSFRIDSDGKQALNKIPLKYSELHLTELLEGACHDLSDYAEFQKEGSDKVNFVRTKTREGQLVSTENILFQPETQRLLQFACESIVEEHEESIIAMYQSQESDVGTKLCVDITGFCHAHNLTDFIETINEMSSAADKKEATVARGLGDDEHGEDDETEDAYLSEEDEEQRSEDSNAEGEKTKHEL